MSTATYDLASHGPEKTLDPGGRLLNVFVAPAQTFTAVRRNRSWWLPFLITVFCTYTFSAVAVSKVGFHQLVVNTMKDDPVTASQLSEMSPEQQASSLGMMETEMKVGMISTPLLVLLYNVGYALLLLVFINVLLDGKADFHGLFAMLLYADLIQNVKPIMSMALLFVSKDPSDFSMQNPVATNAAFFLDPGEAWTSGFRGVFDLASDRLNSGRVGSPLLIECAAAKELGSRRMPTWKEQLAAAYFRARYHWHEDFDGRAQHGVDRDRRPADSHRSVFWFAWECCLQAAEAAGLAP